MLEFSAVLLITILALLVALRLHPRPATQTLLRLTRRTAGLRRHEIQIPGFRLAYLDGGSGAPLVLLHGMGADKDNFVQVARLLVRHYRVIIPDLPGFGESDKPADADYSVAAQIGRVDQFRQALGLDGIHLGGNSMGGFIAGAYAAAYPDAVDSLWLLAPAGIKAARPSPLMTALADGSPLPILARDVGELRKLMAFVMHRPPFLPQFVLEDMAARQRSGYPLNQRIIAELVQGPWLDDLLSHRPRTPALIVWGDRDRALDVSGAGILKELLPVSRVVILREIGHVPMIESPRQAVEDYLAFRKCLVVDPLWEEFVEPSRRPLR